MISLPRITISELDILYNGIGNAIETYKSDKWSLQTNMQKLGFHLIGSGIQSWCFQLDDSAVLLTGVSDGKLKTLHAYNVLIFAMRIKRWSRFENLAIVKKLKKINAEQYHLALKEYDSISTKWFNEFSNQSYAKFAYNLLTQFSDEYPIHSALAPIIKTKIKPRRSINFDTHSGNYMVEPVTERIIPIDAIYW